MIKVKFDYFVCGPCTLVFLTWWIFQECGPFETSGMVTLIQDKAFDVFIRDFGVVKRVYCDVSKKVRS